MRCGFGWAVARGRRSGVARATGVGFTGAGVRTIFGGRGGGGRRGGMVGRGVGRRCSRWSTATTAVRCFTSLGRIARCGKRTSSRPLSPSDARIDQKTLRAPTFRRCPFFVTIALRFTSARRGRCVSKLSPVLVSRRPFRVSRTRVLSRRRLGDRRYHTYDTSCREVAAGAKKIVLSVGYRLAPENAHLAAGDPGLLNSTPTNLSHSFAVDQKTKPAM